MRSGLCVVAASAAGFGMHGAAMGDPFADAVVSYVPGVGVSAGFDDPSAAIGMPTRVTAPGSQFGGPVTPFNAPFGDGEMVSVGEGGSLVIRFDEAVTDDAMNPFGIDLLIFGNAFYFLDSFPDGNAAGLFDEGGVVEVSDDGVNFITVPGASADGGFPTLGFSDLTEGFPSSPGSVESDFTLPVDPSFDPTGLSQADVIAGYAGSGGGLGIDIGAVGLSSVTHVRITNPVGSLATPEIDAIADVRAVPGPGVLAGLVFGAGVLARRRRG